MRREPYPVERAGSGAHTGNADALTYATEPAVRLLTSMSSDTLESCPYCERTPDVCELPEKHGWFQVACHNEECRGKLVSNAYSSKKKAIRAWAYFLMERARIYRRLNDLTVTHHVLWSGTVVWNDIRR